MVCNIFPKSYKQVPITCVLILILVVVFLVYKYYDLKKPCDSDIKSIFLSNFVTIDIGQLIVVLYSLYSLSSFEMQVGSSVYLKMIMLSLMINSVLECMVHKYNSKIPCSLGFNGILMSLIIISLIMSKKISKIVMSVIVIIGIYMTFSSNNGKYVGHIVGAITGLFLSLIYDRIINNK